MRQSENEILKNITQLYDEARAIHRTDTFRAMKLYEQCERIASEHELERWQAKALVSRAECLRTLGGGEEIPSILEQALKLCAKNDLHVLHGSVLNILGIHAYERFDMENAYSYLMQALEIAQKVEDKSLVAIVLSSLGTMYAKLDYFDKAIVYLLKALEQFQAQDDARGAGMTLCNIGAIYLQMEDGELSLDYSLRSLPYRETANDIVGAIISLSNIAEACTILNRPHEAIKWYAKTIDACLRTREKNVGILYSRIGALYAEIGEIDKARYNLNKALERIQTIGSANLTEFLLSCARAYAKLHDVQTAITMFLRGLDSAIEHNIRIQTHRAHNELAELYELESNFEQAYRHQKKAQHIHKEIKGAAIQRQLYNAELRFELLTYENQRATLNLRAEQAEKELEETERRFRSLALEQLQSNRALKTLRSELETTISEANGANKRLAKKLYQQINAEISKKRSVTNNEDDFLRSHHKFIARLTLHAPELTPTELRICVLLKLNFRSKEMADIVFTSTETVNTHRRRIRKKLGLQVSDNLTSYLLSV